MEKKISVVFSRFFLVFVCTSVLLFSSVNRLKKVDIVKGELRLEFTNLYDKKAVKKLVLTNPYRIVFDFKNTKLSYPNMAKYLDKSIRIAQFKPTTVRIVIENSYPYRCTAYQPFGSKRYYHISLPKNRSLLPAKRFKKPKINIEVKSVPIVKKNKAKIKIIPDTVTQNVRKYELIVIDAGHGGHDTGAIGGGKREKDVVLQIAKKVERQLKKRGHPVYMARTNDRFLTLGQRTRFADKKKAVVFISIHANAVAKKSAHKVHGIETFFLQNTRDARSQRVAARENKSVLKGTNKLSQNVIVDSVLSGPKIVQSNKLAIDVHRRIITNVRSKFSGVRDGGVRHAPFWVLVGASRPSILVEVGYISHPKERQRLFNPAYQELVANGIAEGVDNYLDNRKSEIDF
ncbi:MAG: N-acetylmuramoyl-L-alanine amidase [Sulfurovum sp.]|nr:N-acetylmuramoyl-L-alanine amidase [Sulfurovum sp.]